MADIRIKDLPTTASLTASGDFIAIDGTTNGTRKLNAAAPAFLTSVTTPSLTSPAATNLTLGTGTSGAAITVLSASNNVGIGTTTPYATLTVGISDATAVITPGGNNTHLTFKSVGENGALRFFATGGTTASVATTESMRVDAGGNVGIGTASPAKKLDVNGDVNISSTTAGSSGVGALIVQGGISAGNTGAASYFGGAVTAAPAGYSVNASGTYGMSLCQIDNSLDRLGLTAGVSVSGGTFTARYAAPMVVRMAPDVGVFQICVDSGKTIGNAYTPTGQLEISSTGATFAGAVTIAGTVIHTLSATPASASATGTVGTMSWDASYIYICTAANTWKRVAIATW